MEGSNSTESMIKCVLEKMVSDGEKININRVAEKSGVSNSLIHNKYPDLATTIKGIKEKQKKEKESIQAKQEVAYLKQKLMSLEQTATDYEQVVSSYKAQNEELWEHIQQVYGMYDQMVTERNGFAERLKFEK